MKFIRPHIHRWERSFIGPGNSTQLHWVCRICQWSRLTRPFGAK